MTEKHIRKEYSDGKVVLSNVRDKRSNETYSLVKTNLYCDGTVMTAAKVDGDIYRRFKGSSEYFVRAMDLTKSRTLAVNNILELRSLSIKNLILLRLGYYNKVETKGYYTDGDGGGTDYVININAFGVDDGFLTIKATNGLWVQFNPVIRETLNVKIAGVKGDFIKDDSADIQKVFNSMRDGDEVRFPKCTGYRLTVPIVPKKKNIKMTGELCRLAYDRDVDGIVFDMANINNVNISGFTSDNTVTAQTFIRANSCHHLNVSVGYIDGTKLFLDLTNCYWPSIERIQMQSVYQAFQFKGGTNSFNLISVSVAGNGIRSTIDNTIGGNISNGCSFEGKSGRMVFTKSRGVNITGNYFEGYNEAEITNYIEIGAGNYKDCGGFNIGGNLFYAGAEHAVTLRNVEGITIQGNFIGTKHALDLYTFDESNQNNIQYGPNDFRGTGDEFHIRGTVGQASVSPEYNMPITFLPTLIQPKTGQLANSLFTDSKGRFMRNYNSQNSALISNVYFFNEAFLPGATKTVPINIGQFADTGFITVNTVLSAKCAVYVYVRNTNNSNGEIYLKQIFNDLDVVLTSTAFNTLTLKNNLATNQVLELNLKG